MRAENHRSERDFLGMFGRMRRKENLGETVRSHQHTRAQKKGLTMETGRAVESHFKICCPQASF